MFLKNSKYRLGIVFSFAALVAAFWQTAEKIHLLANPGVPLDCNINPIVDCGSVLNHPLSSVFGVSNSLIGIVMFTMLLTMFLVLSLNVKFNMIAKNVLLALLVIALGFSLWFFAVSLYVIGKICIFCIAIWISSISLFYLYVPQLMNISKRKIDYLNKNSLSLIVGTFLIMLALFLFEFRDYYF